MRIRRSNVAFRKYNAFGFKAGDVKLEFVGKFKWAEPIQQVGDTE